MTIFSKLVVASAPALRRTAFLSFKPCSQGNQVCWMGGHGRVMKVTPSRFMWNKFKDLFHLYMFTSIGGVLTLIFTVNMLIGPATLAEIPEGYEPDLTEYYKSPITRFIVRYLMVDEQQVHEIHMQHVLRVQYDREQCLTQMNVVLEMDRHGDTGIWGNQPYINRKYQKLHKSDVDTLKEFELM